jgi:leucyl-tRNA synthetase
VQVNGKVRARITVGVDADEADVQALALADPNVLAHTAGKQVVKVIVAGGRLVSIVVREPK